ncbi:hypothetical protein C8R42DRAFT_646395 [Lentinula raphanica]|nr:hypothetical protein C8R42DRAFT_646395 [Lentinula raphanica]
MTQAFSLRRYDRAFVMTQIQHFFKEQKRRFMRKVEQIRQGAELERKAIETREQNMEEYLKWLGWHLDACLKVDAEFRKERDELRSERDGLREECDSLTQEREHLRLECDRLLERLARNEVLRPVSIL